MLGSLALTAIVQGLVVPHNPQFGISSALLEIVLYYLGVLAICATAGLILENITTALVGYMAASAIAIVMCSVALTLPGTFQYVPEVAAENQALLFVFTAFFPITMLLGLAAALMGAAAREL
jgi:hypothetical protein